MVLESVECVPEVAACGCGAPRAGVACGAPPASIRAEHESDTRPCMFLEKEHNVSVSPCSSWLLVDPEVIGLGSALQRHVPLCARSQSVAWDELIRTGT